MRRDQHHYPIPVQTAIKKLSGHVNGCKLLKLVKRSILSTYKIKALPPKFTIGRELSNQVNVFGHEIPEFMLNATTTCCCQHTPYQ
jgi:hypothetical protein